MNRQERRAILRRLDQVIAEGRPASGFRPQTEEEFEKLQKCQEEACFLMLLGSGQAKSEAEARACAKLLFGGIAGRVLIEATFCRDNV